MKILFNPVTTSSIAHIIRCMSLADEFKSQGDQVFFTSCSNKSKFIESRGYEVVEVYNPVNMNDEEDQSVNYLKSNQDKFIDWFGKEIKAAKEVRPDVVVMASGFLGVHAYHSLGIPTAQIMDSQYFPESSGIMGISLVNDSIRNRILRPILRPMFERKFIKLYLAEVLDIYSKLGIHASIINREDLYKNSLGLIPSDNLFEPLYKKRKNTYHIGPLFWEGFENMKTDLSEKFIKEYKGNEKLIYLTFGGSIFDRNIYDKILTYMTATKYKLIVCLGPNWNREDFPADNSKFIIRKYVPGLRISKYADLIINTGSQGSIIQGLKYGKPQISFPTTIDQSFFASRLEEMEFGININKIGLAKFSKRESYTVVPRDITQRLFNAINKIWTNYESYSKNTEMHMKYLQKYDNPPRFAVQLIKNYLNKNV